MKNYFAAVEAYGSNPSDDAMQDVQQRMAQAYSKIDKAVKRGVLHTNTGARKKARLARALKRQQDALSQAS
ncbi:SSU ribosomal protein S20p [Geitlerinema sp. FC II]|nr:SSU ribosomal protein S20p [Geitlerinema sp. FC II]